MKHKSKFLCTLTLCLLGGLLFVWSASAATPCHMVDSLMPNTDEKRTTTAPENDNGLPPFLQGEPGIVPHGSDSSKSPEAKGGAGTETSPPAEGFSLGMAIFLCALALTVLGVAIYYIFFDGKRRHTRRD